VLRWVTERLFFFLARDDAMNVQRIVGCGVVLGCLLMAPAALAADAGQAELDKAVDAQVAAESESDLSDVIKLCESAIEKGLGEENKTFANQLLASSLTLRGELYANQILNLPVDQNWPRLRELATADLERAAELAPVTARTHLTIARLYSLPEGDRGKAVAALNKAIELKDDDAKLMLRAYVMRAELTDDNTQRLADLNAASELDPKNTDVLQVRGAYYLDQKEFDKALADFQAAAEAAPEDPRSFHAAGIVQMLQEKIDDAIGSFSKAIELDADNADYLTQRARAYTLKGDTQKAIDDLDVALEINPLDVSSLLLRGSNYAQAGDNELALGDIDEALEVRDDYAPAIQMRALLLARLKKIPEAIAALESVREKAPDDLTSLMQLGILYSANKQEDEAIAIFGDILAKEPKNSAALQARADVYLTQGKHAEAIADYNQAVELTPDDSGVLNNLAWVLATSPKDELRDGKRAQELATKACEVTEFKQAHILSTLAAAYAESGDFAKAIEWSKKAVELGSKELQEPLKKELASYEAGKPWREVKSPEPVTEQ
jgi:tetratricopeptide (TPR) repeat protein